jgi:pyruvate,water dikinase
MVYEAVVWLKDLRMQDVEHVGGKNASLGEMTHHLSSLGVCVPQGFATTAAAYRTFLAQDKLDKRIYALLDTLEVNNIAQLTETGAKIRQWILDTPFPEKLQTEIVSAYEELKEALKDKLKKDSNSDTPIEFSVAVRSSATAEDLPNASFAGQQETFLNIEGSENVLRAVKQVFASLFNDRAIAYRVHHDFPHHQVALSATIQQMVRSDKAVSGVMFTLDTESGFDKVVFITASYGLGELIVQGAINPDEFYVYKPALAAGKKAVIQKRLGSKQQKMIYAERAYASTEKNKSNQDNQNIQKNNYSNTVLSIPVIETERKQFSLTEEEVLYLARQAVLIEQHYGRPMDIEWAKDGINQQLYIVQARPETVKSRAHAPSLERYTLKSKGNILIEGRSVGQRIGQGNAVVITHIEDMHLLKPGDVLITDMTDPDWEPVMKRAAAIVTNRGGRTCHAAIIARELGIPAVVGCGQATRVIKTGQAVTVSCAEGDTGFVYEGLLGFDHNKLNLEALPDLKFKIMMTIGNPERAFDFQRLPNAGVGLARLEFIINHMGIHPKACLEFENLPANMQTMVRERSAGYDSPVSYYVEKITEGIATLAAAFWPKPITVRLSDFKSNEYANLLGGQIFEPKEENPMLGFRGASRYLSSQFRDCVALECQALRKVREGYGLTNVEVMIPFVRTAFEAKAVLELLESQGLKRGENGLRIIMMCEIPSNALLAEEFLEYVDGFSIGSNDLTQLTLGLDRDSGLIAHLFDERDEAVKKLLRMAIQACKRLNKSIGICGQGPSDHPDFANWLMNEGIQSVSLNPDSVLSTWLYLAQKEKDLQSSSEAAAVN